jgi:hypothetical protein
VDDSDEEDAVLKAQESEEEGRREGWKEGRKEGRKDGRKEGRKEGRKKDRTKERQKDRQTERRGTATWNQWHGRNLAGDLLMGGGATFILLFGLAEDGKRNEACAINKDSSPLSTIVSPPRPHFLMT